MKLTILGGGAWGTTLAQLAQQAGHTAHVWLRSESLAEALVGVDCIFSALPMKAVREMAHRMQAESFYKPGTLLVSATKGLDLESEKAEASRAPLKTASQVWEYCCPSLTVAALSGPNLATEIAQGLPCATVVAHPDPAISARVQQILAQERFRVYTSSDRMGVELGGALKNVIAIAAGVSDGLGLGTNAKAALVTRGLAEIVRVGVYLNGQLETFYGLSGLGDLLATCNSSLSRNYRVGFSLGKGQPLSEILAQLQGTAEGLNSAQVLSQYSACLGLNTPITDQVTALAQGRTKPAAALKALMERSLKPEQLV
ncbi:MAG: NAD(P)H-dependent glycerol-3-phosphate dehydrogenase [Gloeobacterales cyanobacterium]